MFRRTFDSSGELPVLPSLFRFLLIVGLLAALVYCAMLALVTFVHLTPRPMEQIVPPAKLNK